MTHNSTKFLKLSDIYDEILVNTPENNEDSISDQSLYPSKEIIKNNSSTKTGLLLRSFH